MKRILKYLSVLFLIIVTVLFREKILSYMNPFFYYLLLGVILNICSLISFGRKISFSFNTVEFIIVVIPLLYLSLTSIIRNSEIEFVRSLALPVDAGLLSFFQTSLGFFILSSILKKKS